MGVMKWGNHLFAGTSQERAYASLTEMGPAIMNGGITTSLALIFLSVSESYPYLVFFKVCCESDVKCAFILSPTRF